MTFFLSYWVLPFLSCWAVWPSWILSPFLDRSISAWFLLGLPAIRFAGSVQEGNWETCSGDLVIVIVMGAICSATSRWVGLLPSGSPGRLMKIFRERSHHLGLPWLGWSWDSSFIVWVFVCWFAIAFTVALSVQDLPQVLCGDSLMAALVLWRIGIFASHPSAAHLLATGWCQYGPDAFYGILWFAFYHCDSRTYFSPKRLKKHREAQNRSRLFMGRDQTGIRGSWSGKLSSLWRRCFQSSC